MSIRKRKQTWCQLLCFPSSFDFEPASAVGLSDRPAKISLSQVLENDLNQNVLNLKKSSSELMAITKNSHTTDRSQEMRNRNCQHIGSKSYQAEIFETANKTSRVSLRCSQPSRMKGPGHPRAPRPLIH